MLVARKIATFRIACLIPDKLYIKIVFWGRTGYRLNLSNPKSFNEKLQWLKMYYHRPEMIRMVDKYDAKEYISSVIGEEYIIPTIGVWDHFDEIDFDRLPDKFVLKCTHDSGGVVICKDKTTFEKSKARDKLERALRKKYYYHGREWPYKFVKPRIIAEKYIEFNETENENNGVIDYKLLCFNGEFKIAFTCTDRYKSDGLKVTFFNRNWEKQMFERHYPMDHKNIPWPTSFEKMIELAEKLSEGYPFLRVDFYEINNRPLFGELTFFPGNGFEEFSPIEWDFKLGEWIKLPPK